MDKNYKIIRTNNIDYEFLVLALNHVSPFENLNNIENELETIDYQGTVIFDLLLTTGNNSNRFCKMYFNGKFFDTKSFTLVSNMPEEIKNIIQKYFYKHIRYIEDSILPSTLVSMIKARNFR